MTTEIDKEIGKMCLNCYNLNESGQCKLFWITEREQAFRAKTGICVSSMLMDADEQLFDANQIRADIGGIGWITIKKGKHKEWFE